MSDRKKNTVIFDLFGTLVRLENDSKPFAALARRSEAVEFRDALHLSLVKPCKTLADYLKLLGLPPQVDIDDLQQSLDDDIKNTVLFEDVLPCLKELKENDLKMALISNLATPYKNAFFNHSLESYFDVIVFSCDFGATKPDSSLYEFVLKELGSDPDQAIMVGDSYRSDVEGPSQIGVTGLHLLRADKLTLNPNSIHSLSEIPHKIL